MVIQKELTAIGLMSGTSLDGLDICWVHFSATPREEGDAGLRWNYRMLEAESVSYPAALKQQLGSAQDMTAQEFARLHSDYGLYLGQQVKAFMERHKATPDVIGSHGHTIFHQPSCRFTCQIGSGAGIAAESGVPTVCDFRTTDVALYGQGAPLVPIGDRNLFADFDFCLNLGGFSNISFDEPDGRRSAFDISPVNYVLNYYMRQVGQEYDKDGATARSGKVCQPLLDALNQLPFYRAKGPKSLGREWVEQTVLPLMASYASTQSLSLADTLCTFCEHVAIQLAAVVTPRGKSRVLVTGGGAFNTYLIERMRANAPEVTYYVPDALTVNFKEALIFAFLGVLYLYDIPSCLASVTGATHDNIGGALYK